MSRQRESASGHCGATGHAVRSSYLEGGEMARCNASRLFCTRRKNTLCKLIFISIVGVCLGFIYIFLVSKASNISAEGRRIQRLSLINLGTRLFGKGSTHPVLITRRESPVDIIIRAVYFDNRTREGHHNATVFLLEVHEEILANNSISGCGMGSFRAVNYKIRDSLINTWLRKAKVFEKEDLTHWSVILDCYDLPALPHSKPFVLYKQQSVEHVKRGEWTATFHRLHRTITVEYQNPVVLPSLTRPIKKHPDYGFSISVCRGPVFGSPPLLTEWLRYQRTIGVDHVYFMAEESFIHNKGLEAPEVAKALQEGYLSYTVWESPLNDVRSYYRSQILATENCLYRMLHVSDYVFVVDTDDFFIPLTAHKSLHYYVDKWCHQDRTCGALNIRWVQRYLDCGLKGEVPADGNISSVLASDAKSYLDVHGTINYKTVHRTSAATDILVHRHGVLLAGFSHVLLPINKAYVGHIRDHKKSKWTRIKCTLLDIF